MRRTRRRVFSSRISECFYFIVVKCGHGIFTEFDIGNEISVLI